MQTINIGLIGHKFMGKAHSHAYRDINMFFDLKSEVVMKTLCGAGDDLEETGRKYGFEKTDPDWENVISDPEIDVIDVCTPDNMHAQIAIAAANAGKHVICEKPLALNGEEAQRMYDAVKRNNVRHMCNFVYRGVPALRLARKLIREGEIGEVYHFNAFYQQDFSLSPDFPFVWRMDERVAGAGILGDKGAHVIDMARFLVGELSEVSCCSAVFVPQRRSPEDSGLHKVTTDDAAVFIGRFENNALGMFQVSNMCAGKRNALILEIYGSRGGIRFDLERLNELEVYFEKDRNDVQGYRTINVTSRAHEFIGHWWPSGHIIGWEHGFLHQIYMFLSAIEQGADNESDFLDGLRCQKVIDAVARAKSEKRWVTL